MFSFYLLHRSTMTSNSGDMLSDIHVLADRADLDRALGTFREYAADICQLRVYQRGRLATTFDLLAPPDGNDDDEDEDDDAFGDGEFELPEIKIPPLQAPVLLPGQPVRVGGRVLGYGYTSLYP